MSDERLRELERTWKETGSVEDEAAWLKERVRAGDLTQERLELAAHCGSDAALAAAPDLTCLPREPLEGWTKGLATLAVEVGGKSAGLRLLIAAAHALLGSVAREELGEDSRARLKQALDVMQAIEYWILSPSPRARKHALRKARPGLHPGSRWVADNPNEERVGLLLAALNRAVFALSTGAPGQTPAEVARGLSGSRFRAGYTAFPTGDLQRGIEDEFVPWVLQGQDRVRQRHNGGGEFR